MSTTFAESATRTDSTIMRRSVARTARVAAGALLLIVATANAAAAQVTAPDARSWEFRVTSGAFVPTGDLRNDLRDAQLTAAQLSWLVRPALAITGTFAWARSRDLRTVDRPKLDAFTSDIGIEVRPVEWFTGSAVTLRPFAGIGGGMRSYNYRKLDVAATNNLAAYGTVGGELAMGRVGLRMEVRDYASGFKPLIGTGTSSTRNDLVATAALRVNFHRAAHH